jgi:hypothetical protein
MLGGMDNPNRRPKLVTLVLISLGLAVSGCQSSSRSFQMDSNSRVPFFGLNLSLPKPSSKRKTLETISDAQPQEPMVATAELRTSEPTRPVAPVRSLLPKWLGGESNLPIPTDAPQITRDEIIELQGPREEFR